MSNTDFLFPDYRKRILSLLLLHPESKYHVREIARLTKASAGSLHRELAKLAKAQILLRETSGNQVYYQANPDCSIFQELASILRKTSGLAFVLSEALAPIKDNIHAAFIFGSTASGNTNLGSDIDIMIIGNIAFSDAAKILYSSQITLQREINPKVFSTSEWKKLLKNKNSFVSDILKKPKIFLIGNINDIR